MKNITPGYECRMSLLTHYQRLAPFLCSKRDNRISISSAMSLPAFAGTVHGVVVHIAKQRLGRNSSMELPKDGEALTNLNMAYILFETCPSGYCQKKFS